MNISPQSVKTYPEAVEALLSSAVGVLPTDTVYGLVTRAHDSTAVARLYKLKQRERKPGTLIAASVKQLQELGVPEEKLLRIAPYWPGALSAVLPVGKEFSYLHQDIGDIAMRVVADTTIRALLEKTGPLLTSSANQPGEPSSVNLDEAWKYFGDSIDFYVDGGDLSGRPASTIVKMNDENKLMIIRQGAVTL